MNGGGTVTIPIGRTLALDLYQAVTLALGPVLHQGSLAGTGALGKTPPAGTARANPTSAAPGKGGSDGSGRGRR